MVPRIDTAEVLSFRLKVPLSELEELPSGDSGKLLGLELSAEGNERVLSPSDGASLLRFRVIGAEAILVEIVLAMDKGGVFFERVLGSLMVRHLGDLHVKLVWNMAEKNGEGTGTEVRIVRGATDYPALVRNVIVAAQGSLTGDREGGRPPPLPRGRAASKEAEGNDDGPRLTPEEKEILDLLDKARSSWDEYQRSKNSNNKRNKPGKSQD